jgi:DNA-binding XRE family transcriptional regulator
MRRVVRTPFPADPLITDAMHLGAAVRAARTEVGLTLEEAALTIGVAKQTLADLERGKPTVGLGMALKIVHQLGVVLFLAPASQRERIVHLIQQASD